MTDRALIAYRLVPVEDQPPSGGLSSAACITCMATGQILSGHGGGDDCVSPAFYDRMARGEFLPGASCRMTDNDGKVRVEQCDETAARALLADVLGTGYASSATNVSQVARYFAAHREQAAAGMREALAGLLGGKCPECNGWGKVAYFGEMIDCRCHGKYRHQPTDAQIAAARAALTTEPKS